MRVIATLSDPLFRPSSGVHGGHSLRPPPFALYPLKSLHNQSRGGLPRFHSPSLPSSKGSIVQVQGDEFWHMTKVLRLRVGDRVELFDGAGGLVEGCIHNVHRSWLDVISVEDTKIVPLKGVQWHVYAAFGTLKGGRADWLVEKCTELGASSVTPLLTERSPSISENRVDRLERVVLAAVKQCQRLHEMVLNPPMTFKSFLPIVAQSEFSFLAAAEAAPVMKVLSLSNVEAVGLMVVGPEGDFTEEEVNLMKGAGAKPVGLGPCRLRVETATIALLSTLMLWSDAHNKHATEGNLDLGKCTR
ncbi:LOW QUALITY PROTEIN: ribosomal RNA small subunit methyltransferase E-like [Dioscorea cayenensis subsp. rotundata]|uniref:16S rRNA (uracil(1498)-N(3))-methyltransferase n=1 Tax=Dioscorea cayennensis subsp. rotundata TaxID=55577 RepID=A0AB40CBV5_DIOCR|nr:LOW QUALITY PROTEIN: ribosomal RNA small subunit methyltransferase E-like [Dioscorea cayenensis subsp. rotundata]